MTPRTIARRAWIVLVALLVLPSLLRVTADDAAAQSEAAAQLHLPALRANAHGPACALQVEVQNVGCAPTKLALLSWDAAGACPPDCHGPARLVCSGLLPPGRSWRFTDADVPPTAHTGTILSLSTRRLRQLDPPVAPILADDVTADYLCRVLFFGAVADCHGYRRFQRAWRARGDWAGVSLSAARGEPVVAHVRRACPLPGEQELEAMADHAAVPEPPSTAGQDGGHDFASYAPLVYAGAQDLSSTLHIRNAGSACASVTIWLMRSADCGRARICSAESLAPGEATQVDVTDCAGAGWVGAAWLRSTEPLAVVAEARGARLMTAYRATATTTGPALHGVQTTLAQNAVAPLVVAGLSGWETGLQVQNLSGSMSAKVRLQLLDRSGEVAASLVEWICPRGSRGVFVPRLEPELAGWIGAVRLASMPYGLPGGGQVTPPPIAAVAHLVRYADAALTTRVGALTYPLSPWHRGSAVPGGASTAGAYMLAVPAIARGGGIPGSKIAVMNLDEGLGHTEMAVYLFDDNGLVDQLCQRLGAQQTEYVDLDRYAFLGDGFRGSALVSATAWTSDLGGGTSHRPRLAAARIDPGPWLARSEREPGDWASGGGAWAVARPAPGAECALWSLPTCPSLTAHGAR